MHKLQAVLATNRTVVVPYQLGRAVSVVQRGPQGVLELVVEGVHKCWFQRREGTDIAGEPEKWVVAETKGKNGKKVAVVEGKSGL